MASTQQTSHEKSKENSIELRSFDVAARLVYSSAEKNGLDIIGDRQTTQVIEKYKEPRLDGGRAYARLQQHFLHSQTNWSISTGSPRRP